LRRQQCLYFLPLPQGPGSLHQSTPVTPLFDVVSSPFEEGRARRRANSTPGGGGWSTSHLSDHSSSHWIIPTKNLRLSLDHPDQKSPAFVEQAVQVLVFLVRLVNGLVYVPVGELAGLPTLELLVEWIQDLAPAIVIVVVDQRLLPFSLWCLSTSLTAHLITSACSQVNPSAGRSYRSPGQPPTPLLPMLFVPRPFAGIAAASRRHGPGPLQRTDLSVHTL